MEDFLCLPRFHRDAMIQELWEGPRNVLLTQIHRDLQRVADWYPAENFINDLLEGADSEVIAPLVDQFQKIISHDTLLRNDEATLAICRDWQRLSNELFFAYQDQALKELNIKVKPLKFNRLLRKFKKRE